MGNGSFRCPFFMLQTLTHLFSHFLEVAPEQPSQELEELKSFLDSQLKEKLGFSIDDEKANAMLKKNEGVLVSASAGAGKSLCLLYKIFTLVRKENFDPGKILILSFNRSVANHLRSRAHEEFGLSNMNMFFTFHSLGYRIVKPYQRILCDTKNNQRLSRYMQRIVVNYLIDIGFRYSYPQLKRLTKLVVQFIGRMTKSSLTEDDIKNNADTLISSKAKALTKIALILCRRYQQKKTRDSLIDFDDVITQATQIIHSSNGNCSISISRHTHVKIKDIKHVLVDEWQDLSTPFHNLIKAIQRYSPDLRLFMVGDRKQSCNSFIGADLKYFDQFTDLFEDSSVSHLSMNYRSKKRIVDHANSFMPHEIPMRCVPSHNRGSVEEIRVYRNMEAVVAECLRIINAHQERSIAILCRTNKIFGISIQDFLCAIKEKIDQKYTKINVRIATLHSFKGDQADIIILLKTKGHFPLLHKNRTFFELFDSEADIIEEESRLWFVGITRSKEKLFILKT